MSLKKFRVSSSIRKAGCTLLLASPFVAVSIPIFLAARVIGRKTTCMFNVKQSESSVLQYSLDWDETLPPATQ